MSGVADKVPSKHSPAPLKVHSMHSLAPLQDNSQTTAYCVSFTTFKREPLLADIRGADAEMTPAGKIVLAVWRRLPSLYPNLQLDALAITHDEVHAILILVEPYFAEQEQVVGRFHETSDGLNRVVCGWKSTSSSEIKAADAAAGMRVWSDGFSDRVLRNDKEVELRRAYILNNLFKWWLKDGKW